MPLNAGRSGAFVGLILVSALGVSAQTTTPATTTPTTPTTTAPKTAASPQTAPTNAVSTSTTILPPTAQLPSAADIMRQRVTKAKSFVAIKNYAAAIYELEGIKRESKDPAVNSVTQVMLMNCYLEQMDYKRAQAFLTEIYTAQKAAKPGTNYYAAAGQVVKSARNQLDRYKSLGLAVSDVNLPKEAVADVDKMREMLEMVVTQSKELGANQTQTANAMVLLEEASASRSSLARDQFDAKRWKETLADAREDLMNSRTAVINAVEDPKPADINANNAVASTVPVTTPATSDASTAQIIPVSTEAQPKAPAPNPAQTAQTDNSSGNPFIKKTVISTPTNQPPANNPPARERLVVKSAEPVKQPETKVSEIKSETSPTAEAVKDSSPLQVGSLVEYATEKANPTYPPAARMMRKTGTVRVEILVDEAGKIAEVKNASGESLLQKAATDALKKWKFKPFTRDGQPVKATGYVSFNFNL